MTIKAVGLVQPNLPAGSCGSRLHNVILLWSKAAAKDREVLGKGLAEEFDNRETDDGSKKI